MITECTARRNDCSPSTATPASLRPRTAHGQSRDIRWPQGDVEERLPGCDQHLPLSKTQEDSGAGTGRAKPAVGGKRDRIESRDSAHGPLYSSAMKKDHCRIPQLGKDDAAAELRPNEYVEIPGCLTLGQWYEMATHLILQEWTKAEPEIAYQRPFPEGPQAQRPLAKSVVENCRRQYGLFENRIARSNLSHDNRSTPAVGQGRMSLDRLSDEPVAEDADVPSTIRKRTVNTVEQRIEYSEFAGRRAQLP